MSSHHSFFFLFPASPSPKPFWQLMKTSLYSTLLSESSSLPFHRVVVEYHILYSNFGIVQYHTSSDSFNCSCSTLIFCSKRGIGLIISTLPSGIHGVLPRDPSLSMCLLSCAMARMLQKSPMSRNVGQYFVKTKGTSSSKGKMLSKASDRHHT